MEDLSCTVHESPPADFKPQVEIAANYVEFDGKILLLQKNFHGVLRWGVPAGKLEPGELPLPAALRELQEETGIVRERSQAWQLGSLYIRRPKVDFVFHVFQVQVEQQPAVVLSKEHLDFAWVDYAKLKRLELIPGAETTYLYYQRTKRG